MITKILVVLGVLGLAFGAFWIDALGGGHFSNPVGIMLVLLALLIWFKWEPLREAFISARDASDIPIIRLGYATIKGMQGLLRPPRPRRSSGSAS